MWLRLRYAEYVGTRFTRDGFRSQLPIVLLHFGLTALFGVLFAASVVDGNAALGLLSIVLFLLFLLGAITGLRMLIGYLRPDRYPVVLDLWSDAGPQAEHKSNGSSARRAVLWSEASREPARRPLFERIEGAFWIAFLWLGAVFIWVVMAALLYGLVVGDFPQSEVPAE
jgi:hypothetical protein